VRTALREENGIRSAAALVGSGFDQQRAILAIAPKDYEEELLTRIALVGGKSAVRKDGPWAENLVANPDIDVPESWRPKKIAGRDFRASISELLIGHFGGMDRLPACAAYRHAIVNMISFLDARTYKGRDFQPNPKERKETYTIEDMLTTSMRARGIYENITKHPGMLYTVGVEIRPLVNMTKDAFGADAESFREWRQNHPQFYGFQGYSEADSDFNSYYEQALATQQGKAATAGKRVNGKWTQVKMSVPADVLKRYPITGDRTTDYDVFMRTSWEQMKKVYFGSEAISGLFTGDLALGHKYAQIGVHDLICEAAINGTAAPWSWSGACLRGASRQWDRPASWYMARFFANACPGRDGLQRPGDQRWPRTNRPDFAPYCGGGRSVNRRGFFYGWAMGASTLAIEGESLCSLEDGPNGKRPVMSVYAREFNDIFELNEKVDRGVAYTPIALVGSIRENVRRHGYPNETCSPFAHAAFLYTLVPVKAESALRHSAREKGDQGVFRNSRFGEIWDYLVCDAGQDHAAFAAALSHYPAAFLVGTIDEKAYDAQAVADYVKRGGTLFVTAENVRKGLVDPAFAGVTYGAEKVPFKLGKYDYTAIRPAELAADVTRFDTAFAPTNMQLFTARMVGKGKVVTCAVERYLPDILRNWKPKTKKGKSEEPNEWPEVVEGHIDFPLVRELLTKVQGETIPFEIKGDCQWGVNKVKDRGQGQERWFVWMMNNKGIVKFGGEPEEFDFSETAHVTVVNKLTGEAKSVEIEPGETAFLEF